MTDSLFEVVFQGKLVDGFAATDVKANVARLFKASPQQVEHMFSGKRVVIRNQLDQETALKYQVLLRKNGAICTVETQQPAEAVAPVQPTQATPAASAPPVAASAQASRAPQASTASAASNPFLRNTSAVPVPASESGRLQVAGKRVDSILQGVRWQLEPVGVRLSAANAATAAAAPDIRHLSIAPAGARLADPRDLPPPIVPDVEHLSIAPAGTRLSDPDPDE